jgi:hypothetical protein
MRTVNKYTLTGYGGRISVPLCSGLYLLIGMTSFSSQWILSHSTWYKFRRSRHFSFLSSNHSLEFLGGLFNRNCGLEVSISNSAPKRCIIRPSLVLNIRFSYTSLRKMRCEK